MRMLPLLFVLLLACAPLAAQTPPAEGEAAREAREAARTERDAARDELRQAQEQLRELSGRIAELSRRIAREDIEAALARPAFGRPMIGVVLQSDPERGVRLSAVTPRGPAASAGLKSGDRLLAIDGKPIGSGDPQTRLDRARGLIGEPTEGQKLRLDYERDGKTERVEVAAETLPGLVWWRDGEVDVDSLLRRFEPAIAQIPWELGMIAPFAGCATDDSHCLAAAMADTARWRGLRLASVDARLGRYFGTERGVLVLAGEGLPEGLAPGDVLLEVDGTAVDHPSDAMRALRARGSGERVEVKLLRDRKRVALQIAVPERLRFPLLAPPPPAPPAPPTPASRPVPPPAAAPPAPPAVPAAPPPPPKPPVERDRSAH